ncbi:unnamed protein product [Symbiodinium natans]|uniref:EGF-like domain-containing protein n=1 Tax=Symbiodinium natans TaxID=878477 RepID=A0A812RPC7_9DINO|nr:unnamed protein product [Symbiodinium natans]
MQGATASHLFDDTMMYWYLKRNVFQSLSDFFEHKVALYMRFDRDQLRQLKSCQLQVGLINEAAFNLVKDAVKEDRRLFASFPFMKSNPFCWQPDNWNAITHRFSPQSDASVTANLVTMQATMRLDELLNLIFDTEWTVPQEPFATVVNLKLRTKLDDECDAHEDLRATCSACSQTPCRNGGNCTDMPGFTYQCSCADGFFGEDCSETDPFSSPRRLEASDDFACNATQAEPEYPEGKFWCKCRNGTEVAIRPSLISVIKSWGIFFNYVPNFNNSYSEITCADASMTVKTPSSQNAFTTSLRTATAPNASQNVLYIEQKNWGSGFARSTPFYLMLSGLAGIERVLVSDIQVPDSNSTDPFTLEVLRGLDSGYRLKFDLEDPGDPPAAPSTKWICHARLYNDGRQCDCRCGMPDPDCFYPNLPVRNCGRGEVCSRMGRCTTPEASSGLSDATEIYLSEPCTQLFLPGSTDLAGFMGTEDEYRNVSGGGCPTCPFEPGNLYGGSASLSEQCDDNGQCFQEYMCRYKAEGFIDARLVKKLDDYLEGAGELFDTTQRGFYTLQGGAANASNAYRVVVVKLGSRSPFPHGLEVAEYKLDINQDCGNVACGNKEIIEVVKAGAPDRSNRQVLMVRALAPSGFQKQHFSYGNVISALSESSTDVIVQLDKEKYHFPISGPYEAQLDAIGIKFQQSSPTQSKKIQRLLLETPLELSVGFHTSIVQDVPPGLNPDGDLHPKAAFDNAVTIASHIWYGTTVDSTMLDMYSWEWPTVDVMGLGAIQESSSLAFVFNTSLFADEDRGNGCSEAYLENASTMKWVKVDSDYDGVADTWQGLFGSEVTSANLCDGIHDGHAVVTDQGITEALAAAKEQNLSVNLLLRDVTGTQVLNFEIRQVVNAWKYRSPVWWPDDPDSCWEVNDNMLASDDCSCKDDCRCMPGCSEEDCSTDNVSLRSYTCAYMGVAANMTSRIQVKGSLRWLPEDWLCPGSAVATASYFGDGICDCGCARYDPDCAGIAGNPQAFAEELDAGNITVRNYCADEAIILGSDGWNTLVTSSGCQGFFFLQLNDSSTHPTRWLPRGTCQREEEVVLTLDFIATCAFDDMLELKPDPSANNPLLLAEDLTKLANCADADASAKCSWSSASEAKYHCSLSASCQAVYCESEECYAASAANLSAWKEPPSKDENSTKAEKSHMVWFKSDTSCHTAPPSWLVASDLQSCTDACEARDEVCDEIALNLIDTENEMQFLAGAVANLSCSSYANYSFTNGPGICTNNSCCGDECYGLCVFGHTGSKRSCGTSEADHAGLLRVCPCRRPSQVQETSVNSTKLSAHVPETPFFEEARPLLANEGLEISVLQATLAGQIPLHSDQSRYSQYVNIRNSSWPYSDNSSNWTTEWTSEQVGLRVLSLDVSLDVNSTALTSNWHMTWRYALQTGIVSAACPPRLLLTNCSFVPAYVFVNGNFADVIYFWAVANSSTELDSWVASDDVVGRTDTCFGCKNMTGAITLNNTGSNEVSIVFEEYDLPTAPILSIQQLSFLPTCQVAVQDVSRYRFCKPSDATPTWDKSKIRQTSLYHWQREKLEVLAFAGPVRMRHDRGTVVETVVMSANITDANPLDFRDPDFFDLEKFGIQNESDGSRLLAWTDGLTPGMVSSLQDPLDLEAKGSTEDLRTISSFHAQRPGSAMEVLARLAAEDHVPPEVTHAEVIDGKGEVRLVFTEWVKKAKRAMLASLRVIPVENRRQTDQCFVASSKLQQAWLHGACANFVVEVDLARGKVFVEDSCAYKRMPT